MEVRDGNTVLAVPEEGLPPQSSPDELTSGELTSGECRYAVRFTARAEEYFRIWIVNLALTIITLGIYSAWAKVRKKRYFYGHTFIEGECFEYRGKPLAILKGRVIAFVLLALYYLAGQFAPIVQLALMLALAVVVPWLVVRSLSFNAWNSAYRNVQFHFRGTYAEALRVIVGNGLLVLISLGVLYPYWKSRLAVFITNHHHYGTTPFQLPALTRHFYRVYGKAAALLFGYFAIGMFVLVAGAASVGREGIAGITIGFLLFAAMGYLAYLFAFASIRARITNLTWNHMRLGAVRFESTLSTWALAWLYFVNIFAIVVTIGIAIPWAVVRTMRYRCENTTVVAEEGLDRFLAARSQSVDATGEAVGELFSIDIGL